MAKVKGLYMDEIEVLHNTIHKLANALRNLTIHDKAMITRGELNSFVELEKAEDVLKEEELWNVTYPMIQKGQNKL